MARVEPENVKHIANVGAGPIGGGWSAHFLANGYEVTTYMHDAGEEEALRALIETAWPSLETLGLAAGASLDNLRCTTDLEEAVANAEFVQESVPENLELKQALYETLGEIVPDDVVISSSTSGLPMSDIQVRCRTAERTVVGHPFNPPYLLPLVEMIGGARTSPDTVQWTAAFYRLSGKAPLIMDRELPGFIATRLQEALWREALHMVANGDATVEQIDTAIVHGPGPRWAVMGPCMAFHAASGEGGMAHNLDHFGPALKLPWTRLEAPELTQDLRDRMVDGCDRESAGRDFEALASERDAGIVSVLKGLRGLGLPK
jgi:carnitine 3-dehydrogenase